MASAVWKFPVPLADRFTLELPVGAEILHFDEQDAELFLWVRLDPRPERVTELREFRLAGTGHQLEDVVGEHLGTTKVLRGALVWHLFEAKSTDDEGEG